MGKIRTMAIQVPEELFFKIKDYLQRNNVTQKDFILGLIEDEIIRDLQQREAEGEVPEESEKQDEEESEEEEIDEDSDPDEDAEHGESESHGMKMGM